MLEVVLEEEGDLGVALLFEVAHYCVAAEGAFAEDFFDLHQVLLLQSDLEQVVSVVYCDGLNFSLSTYRKDLILHKECHVARVLDALESPRSLALAGKHVLEMRRCRIDE